MKTFAEQIRAELDARGVTRAQLAWRTQVSPAAVSRSLRPGQNLRIATMAMLACALDLELHVQLVQRAPSFEDDDASLRLAA